MNSVVKKQIISSPFTLGMMILLSWFFWSAQTINAYNFTEWAVFFAIALVCWEPAAAWLREGARWVPAAEIFFLLHLNYYVVPFVSAREEVLVVESEIRLQAGLLVLLFLVTCRCCYAIKAFTPGASWSKAPEILRRDISVGPRKQLIWIGLIGWALFNIALQQNMLPDVGAYFNTLRTLITSIGSLSMFILFFDLGCKRLDKARTYLLCAITSLTLLISISSGFLIGATAQVAILFVAFSIGRKQLPVIATLTAVLLLAFLHVGKGEMRAAFWDEGQNFSLSTHSPIEIYEFWLAASWNQIIKADDAGKKPVSIVERTSLLQYLSRVVDETPSVRPHMDGLTYIQSLAGFVPRFLWPDKPRASTPDETLSIYYGYQTVESVDITAIGLGKISEGWANFGWVGVFFSGALMGLILLLPRMLSIGKLPSNIGFLLSISFVTFVLNLESCMGPAINSLVQNLILVFGALLVIAKPVDERDNAYVPSTRDAYKVRPAEQ